MENNTNKVFIVDEEKLVNGYLNELKNNKNSYVVNKEKIIYYSEKLIDVYLNNLKNNENIILNNHPNYHLFTNNIKQNETACWVEWYGLYVLLSHEVMQQLLEGGGSAAEVLEILAEALPILGIELAIPVYGEIMLLAIVAQLSILYAVDQGQGVGFQLTWLGFFVSCWAQ